MPGKIVVSINIQTKPQWLGSSHNNCFLVPDWNAFKNLTSTASTAQQILKTKLLWMYEKLWLRSYLQKFRPPVCIEWKNNQDACSQLFKAAKLAMKYDLASTYCQSQLSGVRDHQFWSSSCKERLYAKISLKGLNHRNIPGQLTFARQQGALSSCFA